MPAGRPREHDREAIRAAFDTYVASTTIPIVAEFAASQGLWKQFLYDHEEFADSIKRCISKKEGALERLGLQGKVNATMAIFSLKQLGWKDKVEHSGDKAAPLVLSTADANL